MFVARRVEAGGGQRALFLYPHWPLTLASHQAPTGVDRVQWQYDILTTPFVRKGEPRLVLKGTRTGEAEPYIRQPAEGTLDTTIGIANVPARLCHKDCANGRNVAPQWRSWRTFLAYMRLTDMF